MAKVFKPELDKGTTEFGGVVKISITNEVSENLWAGQFVLKPGDAIGPETEEDKFFYILDGTLTVENPDAKTEVSAGKDEILFIPKGELHKSCNKSNGTVKVLWCHA